MRRLLLTLMLAAWLAAACGGDGYDDGGVGGDTTPPAVADDEGEATTAPAAGQPKAGRGAGGSSTMTDGADNGSAAPAGSQLDRGPVGALGTRLLDPAAPDVVVEVAAVKGYSFNEKARSAVKAALEQHGGKAVTVVEGVEVTGGRPVWTREMLDDLSSAHRTHHSTDKRPAILVLVLDNEFVGGDVAGVAFNASGIAIFPDEMDDGLLGGDYMDAIGVHEVGHLFGLVNITGKGADHEDPEHKGHSSNRGSVMYWAVDQVSVRTLLAGGPPTTFDAADRAEMTRIRGREA